MHERAKLYGLSWRAKLYGLKVGMSILTSLVDNSYLVSTEYYDISRELVI